MRLNPMRTFSASDNSEIIDLFLINDYFEPRTTTLPSLVVSMSDYGTVAPGSILWWAHILQCLSFLSFLAFYAELLHTSYM